jgi:hypothetical protein
MQAWMVTLILFFLVQFAAFVWWMSRTSLLLERVEKAFENLEKRWEKDIASIWKRMDDLRVEFENLKVKVYEK